MVGRLRERRDTAQLSTFAIDAALSERDRVTGASVAVSGVCLTVTSATDTAFEVELAFETLRRTTLGRTAVGDRLNLEPALRVGDALGGHLVSGHVDGVAHVRSVTPRGEAREVWFDSPGPLLRYIAPKGSVTLDGTSLTVNEVDAKGFCVGLVPHTRSVTTLGALGRGDAINLEVDLLARYVERLLTPAAANDDALRRTLVDAGYAPEGPQ